MGIVKNEWTRNGAEGFLVRDIERKGTLGECSLGVALIPMGVWRSEDLRRISKKKRQWQGSSATYKNGEGRKLLNEISFLLDRCPLNGCRCSPYKPKVARGGLDDGIDKI